MTKTENEQSAEQTSGLDQLRQELSKYVSAQVDNLAGKVGQKLTDITEKLTDAAQDGGSLLAIGSSALQAGSPLMAFASETGKSAKGNVAEKAKAGSGGGKRKRKAGGGKVMNIIEVLDVGLPLRQAYDYWTQYDRFSSFAKGVNDVSKSDDVESDWKVKVGPSSRSFKATVQEQIPDDRIVWTSEGAMGTTRGAVSFHELAPTLTRIILVVEYYPSGFFEKTGNLWRVQGRRMRLDFKNFQRYVTLTNEEPEGWRGEIRDGEVVVSHEEAVEQEEADQDEPEDGEPEDEGEGGAGEGADSEYEGDGEDEGAYEDEEADEEEEEPDEEEEEAEAEGEAEDEDVDVPRTRRGSRRRG